MFITPPPYFFLEFQIAKYKKLIYETHDPKAWAFCTKELHNLQQHLITFYN